MKKSVKESRVACFIRNGLLILILVIMSSKGYSQQRYTQLQFIFRYDTPITDTDGTAIETPYRHHITTRHVMYNAIDFYLWKEGQEISDLGENRVMSLTNDGVGINVGIPTAKLDVDGDVRFRSLDPQPNFTNYNKVLVANSDGKIGSAPVSELSSKLWDISGSESTTTPIFRTGKVGIGIRASDIEDDIKVAIAGKTHIGSSPRMSLANIQKAHIDEFNLFVHGGIVTQEVLLTDDSWKDEVFQADYKLPTLEEWDEYIEKNKHLPGIPSEKDIIENGYQIHDMNKRFLEKIEQMVLHTIRQQREIEVLQLEIKKIKRTD